MKKTLSLLVFCQFLGIVWGAANPDEIAPVGIRIIIGREGGEFDPSGIESDMTHRISYQMKALSSRNGEIWNRDKFLLDSVRIRASIDNIAILDFQVGPKEEGFLFPGAFLHGIFEHFKKAKRVIFETPKIEAAWREVFERVVAEKEAYKNSITE